MRVNIVFPADVGKSDYIGIWERFMGLFAPFSKKEASMEVRTLYLTETGDLPCEVSAEGQVDCIGIQKDLSSGTLSKYLSGYLVEHPAELCIFAPTMEGKILARLCAAANKWEYYGEVVEFAEDEMQIIRKVYSTHKDAIFRIDAGRNVIVPTAGGEKQECNFSAQNVVVNYEKWPEEKEEQGRILKKIPKPAADDISKAKLVFIGGRGLKKKENYVRLKELAKKCGAFCGCTRPVALSGWEDYSNVVGISGNSLTATVCVTFGVSGSAPFLYGMENVGRLIAINTDPDAPVFAAAQDGMIEDCIQMMEEMEKVMFGEN